MFCCLLIVVDYISIFINCAVGADNGVFSGFVVPNIIFYYGIPLCHRAHKSNGFKIAAVNESIFTYFY